MFLKSLTLKGFKSFAETTTLELAPGVSVVVGPNGSGKSNVVDAITWVLGAQGPRSLRSQKMDDVIFAGTTARPALGRAEVQLTLDNSAGLIPIDLSEVTISRTLYRSGDSEYALNGAPCRLLDIQDLLSDAGVGRHQHVIIAQGQIDEVLNARPEDRRLIVEEAAGILKFRRRKERAERRLEATEANLVRLQDLMREVRRQLRPLERQADDARRHGALREELQLLQRFLAGRDIAALRARVAEGAERRTELAGAEQETRRLLGQLDVDITALEAQLSATGDDVLERLGRAEAVRERARGLRALLSERRRGVERDRRALLDADVVASLEADASVLRGDLDLVDDELAAIAPHVAEIGAALERLRSDRSLFDEQWADEEWSADLQVTSGQVAELRGEVSALRSAVARAGGERAGLVEQVHDVERRIAEAERDAAAAASQVERSEEVVATARSDAEAAASAMDSARSARSAHGDAERLAHADHERWAATVAALTRALDAARSRAGVDHLAGVDGVLGALLDLVEVRAGYEAAVEAALGDALSAVVVADVAAARRALQHLQDDDVSGAVLVLGGRAGAGEHTPSSLDLPRVATPVRSFVTAARPAVSELLDALLARAVVVEGRWYDAVEAHAGQPGLVCVTRAGDRISDAGWRVGTGAAGATGAALADAESRATEALAALRRCRADLDAAEEAERAARRASGEASALLESALADLAAARVAAAGAVAVPRELAAGLSQLRSRLDELDATGRRDQRRLDELAAVLPVLEAEERTALEAVSEMQRAQQDLDARARTVAALEAELAVKRAGLEERRQILTDRLAGVERRLDAHRGDAARAQLRRARLERHLDALDRLGGVVERCSTSVETELVALRERHRARSEASRRSATRLEQERRRRHELEQVLDQQRLDLQKVEVEDAELRIRLESLTTTVRQELGTDVATALAAECPPLPEGMSPPARARDLERELRRMGPINPLALREFEELTERHDFVSAQIDDVRRSRRELTKVIAAIDDEIVQVFSAAYADVSANFTALFDTLFPGGSGQLALTDPGDLLGTGVEISARPSGKNVRKLSLLSGGERSLTALAFLFAVFRSRPSPFYVMDEVEAALDDVNLHRFLGLVAEFRAEAQLVIVTHQRRTMEAGDCLYGVTMQPGGSSKVVTERAATG
jgi:chromosome segregation protein